MRQLLEVFKYIGKIAMITGCLQFWPILLTLGMMEFGRLLMIQNYVPSNSQVANILCRFEML